MKTTLNIAAICAGMFAASAAFAADLPSSAPAPAPVYAAPIFTWTGFYAGVNAGYSWNNSDLRVSHLPTQAAFGADPYSRSIGNHGFIGGAQVGYNVQSGNLVYGLEADFQGASANKANNFGPLAAFGGAPQPGSSGRARARLKSLGTVRGRLGWAVESYAEKWVTE